VFPSLEAFERGVELPVVYVVFYDFFYHSSVGDAAWKRNCSGETNVVGTVHKEAFAMVVLKNNYFAWLLEAKESLGDKLATDYDEEDISEEHRGIDDGYVKKELNLEGDMSHGLVIDQSSPQYQAHNEETKKALQSIRQVAQQNQMYQEIEKKLPRQTEDFSNEQERHKKRQKLLKGFREYTTAKNGEGKFKGWSGRAAKDMGDRADALKAEGAKRALFMRAYCKIYKSRQQRKRKPREAVDEAVVKRCDDMDDISIEEM
jgi:hypothetical protein